MIPKIIHYCWFGGGEKPKLVKKCIKSWKKHLPDYEIIEWNEDNFDINSTPWTKQAYESKKYAFVADYVRLYALKNIGGIYLDSDELIVKSLDEFLGYDCFTGFMNSYEVTAGVIGAVKNHPFINSLFELYNGKNYIENTTENTIPNTVGMTEILLENGLKLDDNYQVVCGVHIFPRTYFCPTSCINNENLRTKDTVGIHLWLSSWHSKSGQKNMKRAKRHTTWWYRVYEQVAAYPIAAYKKIFKGNKIVLTKRGD